MSNLFLSRRAFALPDAPLGPVVAPPHSVRIGAWYTPWWDGGRFGIAPTLGVYNAQDPKIIAAHRAMMRECGIDFVVFDDSNTIFVRNSEIDHTIKAWYDAMDAVPERERLELCIGFGGELNQHSSVESFLSAGDYLFKTHAGHSSQLKLEGKPLVLWYIEKDILPDWKDDRWTIRRAYHWNRTPEQAKWGGWGWGSKPLPPPNKECMSIMSGWHFANIEVPRQGGLYYMRQWVEVLRNRPRHVTICDWNNLAEATAIEDAAIWTDYYGSSTPDWYRQITLGYSNLLRTGRLSAGWYYQDESDSGIYQSAFGRLKLERDKPHCVPVLLLPHGWIDRLTR